MTDRRDPEQEPTGAEPREEGAPDAAEPLQDAARQLIAAARAFLDAAEALVDDPDAFRLQHPDALAREEGCAHGVVDARQRLKGDGLVHVVVRTFRPAPGVD